MLPVFLHHSGIIMKQFKLHLCSCYSICIKIFQSSNSCVTWENFCVRTKFYIGFFVFQLQIEIHITGKPYCPYMPDNWEFTAVKITTKFSFIAYKQVMLIPIGEKSEMHTKYRRWQWHNQPLSMQLYKTHRSIDTLGKSLYYIKTLSMWYSEYHELHSNEHHMLEFP
jgi:hypothetical protein